MTEAGSNSSLFGISSVMTAPAAVACRSYLGALWDEQVNVLPRSTQLRAGSGQDLRQTLEISKSWFDPVASSRKLRDLIARAPVFEDPPFGESTLTLRLGNNRRLITPEGLAALWLLRRMDVDSRSPSSYPVSIATSDMLAASQTVADVYRGWVQARVVNVAALLQDETSTLRPTAAGLWFFLLLNRHTSVERLLLRPREAVRATAVNEAIASTVMTFAQLIGGSERASVSGFDVYRGWAYGEIARRLGADWGEDSLGVWIEPGGVDRATKRLAAAVRSSFAADPANAAKELRAPIAAYNASRPRLAALGMAFERPTNTEQIVATLSASPDKGEALI